MQQRYYDPIAGRFLSIDPMTVNTNKGENFNGFVYGANNPYKYVDPDGRDIKIVGTEDYRKTVLADLATTREKPHGAALVSAAEKTPQTITIRDSPTGLNFTASPKTSNKVPANSTVFYNPSSTQGGTDENGSTERPAFIGLVHEIRHALAAAEGKQVFDKGDRKSGTTPPSEEEAMKTENAVRKEHDLPQRPHYY
jgi:hypothetical protein